MEKMKKIDENPTDGRKKYLILYFNFFADCGNRWHDIH